MTPRLRGRRGVEQRKRRLMNEPLCRHCAERGITRHANEVDHIVPLSAGGEDVDGNCQSLCTECHSLKSATEASGGGVAHPAWLKPSAIPLTIICGPPCSGKSTYAKQHAKPGDILIDLDEITTCLFPAWKHWQPRTNEQRNASLRRRNAMLASLSKNAAPAAWFIVAAPSEAERKWWQAKLGGSIVLLHPGADECKRRAAARGTPNAVKGVDDWERAAGEPWAAKSGKAAPVRIGLDGWPATNVT